MLVFSIIVVILSVPMVVFGIIYVPRHDGRLVVAFWAVVFPTAILCWGVWQVLHCCWKTGQRCDGGEDR